MPVAEALAVVSAANSAYKVIKTAVANGRDMADFAGHIGKFWDAKEELSALEQNSAHPNILAKTFGAKSVENQALQITLHKNKLATLEQELRETFIYTGNGNLWDDMMKERRNIRNRRFQMAKRKAENRKLYADVFIVVVFTILFGSLISLLVIISAT
tara:strand:+ start:1531 stop:2004 length:474 start_codon:yes stop_codon:yes gene_type:complete